MTVSQTLESVSCTWCGDDANAGSHNYCLTSTCNWCGEDTATVSHTECGDTATCTWCGEGSNVDHSLCQTGG